MNAKLNRVSVLSLSFLAALLFCVFIWQTSAAQPVMDYGFIALLGDDVKIDQAASPFINDGRLSYVREYGIGASSVNQQQENPAYSGGTLPNNFNIKIYQVMAYPPDMNPIVAEVQNVVNNTADVNLEKNLRFLAYAPDQLLVSGECFDASQAANGAGLVPVTGIEAVEFTSMGSCYAVGLYHTLSGLNVRDTVAFVNQFIQDEGYEGVLAQPNQITMGFPGSHWIFGSPAGMETPGDPNPAFPESPFFETGQGIAVALFDTSPYVGAPEISTQFVNSRPIQVNQALPVPNEIPFSNQSVVGSHGTFVATPITELAPDSDIFLFRSLSLDAIGTEFWLIEAIDVARDYFLNNGDTYNGVIFNYSLGLEEALIPEPLDALSRTLSIVHDTNIAQVAAAGNNSAWSFSPEVPNLPASHPNVIGVTAIAPGSGIACYANQGDIATWGGGQLRGGPNPCLPSENVSRCANLMVGNCLSGYDPHSPNNWAFGVGTSFASPIIAAMLAQRMETIGPPRSENWASPEQARNELEQEAIGGDPDLGAGYIGEYEIPLSVGLVSAEQMREEGAGHVVLLVALFSLLTVLFVRRRLNTTD